MENCTLGITLHPGRVVDLKTTTGTSFEPCCEDSFRLLLIKSGSVVIEYAGSNILVEAPAVYCIENGKSHQLIDSNDLRVSSIYFKPSIINDRFGPQALTDQELSELSFTERQDYRWLDPFLQGELETGQYVKLGPQSLQRVHALVEQLDGNLVEQPDLFWPCRSRSFLLEILFLINNMRLVYQNFKTPLQCSYDQRFTKILLYIHSHYQDNISLAQLSKRFNSNRTTINSLFSQHTGKSAMTYLRSLRVSLACLILRDTMRPVQEIAELSGFSDITNFGRQFKNIMNCSPTDYRNEHSWMLQQAN